MGGLYGSEYWTYVLPRPDRPRADRGADLGAVRADRTRRAVEIGLLDDAFGADVEQFRAHVSDLARDLAAGPHLSTLLAAKRRARRVDEQVKPLSTYRTEELAKSHECFFGDDRSYHDARHRFVHKLGAPCVVTPRSHAAAAASRLSSRAG